jgi:hypothetical protein
MACRHHRLAPPREDAMTNALALATLATLLLCGVAHAQTGAKALFYGHAGSTIMPGGAAPGAASRLGSGLPSPATGGPGAPATQEYMGVSYWVDRIDGAQGRQRVTSDHLFRTGDRIRIGLTTNRDGYLYVVNLGSTGRNQVLFPSGAAGEGGNFVRANTVYEIPPAGSFRFDSNAGEEVLVLMLAPTDDSVRQAVEQLDKDAPKGGKGPRGAKDLVLEVDRTGPAPATYAVAPMSSVRDGGPISLQIRLRHQ